MSIKHSTTVIGKQSLESIVAEFKAEFGRAIVTVPPGEGWVESSELCARLKMNRWLFGERMREGIRAGRIERAMGSKMRAHGKATSAVYYRMKTK